MPLKSVILFSTRRLETRKATGVANALGAGALLSFDFVPQINHLPNVMLDVRGALHDHVETHCRIRARTRIFRRPVIGRLRTNRFDYHRHSVIKAIEGFIFRRRVGIVELARAVGTHKREAGLATLDAKREAAVLRRAGTLAREAGLPEEAVRQLFWTIIGICRHAQEDTP